MVETFRAFDEVVGTATREELQALIRQIIEVIEWHEDASNPGTGYCRMSYFEQLRPGLKRGNPTAPSGDTGTVGSINWLPGLSSTRTCRNSFRNSCLWEWQWFS